MYHTIAIVWQFYFTAKFLSIYFLNFIFQEFNPKLSDFGLAKFAPLEGSGSHVSTRIMGTYGYAAPEYVATGKLYCLFFCADSSLIISECVPLFFCFGQAHTVLLFTTGFFLGRTSGPQIC